LLFDGKVIAQKGVASSLDHFQITSQGPTFQGNGTDGYTFAVAEGDSSRRRLVVKKDLGRTGRGGAQLYFGKREMIIRQTKAGGQGVFGCPAAELPVGSTLGEAHVVELGQFSRAEPIAFDRHVLFGLLQPVNLHRETACKPAVALRHRLGRP
jgi:hypothetical protein